MTQVRARPRQIQEFLVAFPLHMSNAWRNFGLTPNVFLKLVLGLETSLPLPWAFAVTLWKGKFPRVLSHEPFLAVQHAYFLWREGGLATFLLANYTGLLADNGACSFGTPC